MKRLPDWEKRLAAHVDDAMVRSFEWGQHDCALFAAGAVDAMCGTAIADEFRGEYDDLAGANTILALRGWSTLADAARQWCGEALERPLYGKRGDVVWIPAGIASDPIVEHGCLGILLGPVLAPSRDRLARLPLPSLITRGAMVFPVGAA